MGVAMKTQPDFEAEIQNVSAKTGVPLETVRAMPEEVKAKVKEQEVDVDDLAMNFPKASKFLSEPKNAVVSSDDIGVFKKLENGWKAFKSGIEKGSIQDDMAELLYKDMNGEATPAEKMRLDMLKSRMQGVEQDSKTLSDESNLSYFLNQGGYAGRQMVSSVREGLKGGAAGAAAGAGTALVLGQLGPQVALPEELVTVPGAAMAGGRYGYMAGSAWQSYKAESGFAWDEFKDLRDQSGKPLDPNLAKGAAKAVGVINAGLDVIGEQAMMKLFPGLEKLTALGPKAAVKELLKNETVAARLAAFGKDWVKAATIEGITEGVQELSTILGGEAAKALDQGQFQSIEVGPAAARVAESAKDAFSGSLVLGAAGGVTNQIQLSAREKIEARKMQQNADLIRAIGDTAKESKLLERMPEKYKELVATIKEGGPVENVFIPAEKFTEYFQGKGVDPALVAEEIGAKNFKEAVAAGSDVMVPIENYASTIAKTDAHEALAQDIRFYQEDKTLREYAESLQQKQEQQAKLKEMADQQLKTDEQAQIAKKIQERFKENLVNIGTDNSTAEAYATSFSRAMMTLAERSGIDPMQLAERFSVSRPMPGVMDAQRPDMSIDPVLDLLRSDSMGKVTADMMERVNAVKPYLESLGIDLKNIPDNATVRSMIEQASGNMKSLLSAAKTPDDLKTQILADLSSIETEQGSLIVDDKGHGIGRAAGYTVAQDYVKRVMDQFNASKKDMQELARRIEANEALSAKQQEIYDALKTEAQPKEQTSPEDIFLQPVYHGSPHRFDEFTTEKIGAGEGNQAFGWGLYFAGNKAVAEWYRESLGQNAFSYNGKGLKDGTAKHTAAMLLWGEQGNKEQAKESADGFKNPAAVKKAIDSLDYSKIKHGGQLYKVEIPEDGKYLLWDTPLNEQPKFIQDVFGYKGEVRTDLNAIRDELELLVDNDQPLYNQRDKVMALVDKYVSDPNNAQIRSKLNTLFREYKDNRKTALDYFESKYSTSTGEALYRQLSKEKGGDKEASEYLNSKGVLGIKYLDRDSRGFSENETFNYVIFDDEAIKVLETYYQNQEDSKGYIQIGQSKLNIALLEKADLSTLLHELGHGYLQIIEELASSETASDQLKGDFQTLLKWFGVTEEQWKGFSMEEKRQYHEQFARGHEAYLMEGKAPSEELRSVFSRFKDWLKFIYKQLSSLNVRLNDDVRSVFDRIYATDDEISAARRDVPIDPLFATAKDAGMSEAEFQVYAKAAQKQIESGKEALMAKLMKEMQREKEAWWLKSKNETRQEVEAEISARPEYKAFDALKAGKIDEETPVKLNRDALKNKYGKEFVKRIPSVLMTKEGGMDADTAASFLGYASGDKLIEDMVSIQPKDKVVKAEVDKRMVQKHGDMLLDMSVVDQAKIALHNDDREKVLMTELQAINRKRKEAAPFVKAAMDNQKQKARAALDVPPKEFFRDTAQEIVTNIPVKDIQPYAYLRAQRKAAREAFENMGKGNFELAKQAKERELLNHHLYIEATKAKEEADKIYDYAKKFEKAETRQRIGKAGGDYLQQIDAILDRYEFRRIPLSKLEKRRSLLDWVQEQEAQGLEPAIDEKILDEARSVNFKEISIGELRAVRDSVKNIEHLARLKNKLIINNQKLEFQDAVGELVAAAALNGKNIQRVVDPALKSNLDLFKDKVKSIDATLLKMEQLVEWLDDGNVEGPWHKYLWNPIAAAQTAEYDMMGDIGKKITESFEKMPKEQRVSMLDAYDVPGIGRVSKKFIISMAFNMGNQENIDKMMKGHGWSMTEIEAALQNLNQADWQFVQETWDTINSLWPKIEELEKKMSGVAPPKVQAKPYTARMKNGETMELRGGYYPLAYDPNFSEAGAKQESGNLSQMFEQGYVRATTSKGHTKARVEGFAAPLVMDFEQVITGHLAKVVKDLTHREAIVAANKVITNAEVRASLQSALGVEYEKQFMPWLRSVVNDRNTSSIQGAGAATRLMMQVRANTIAATMGYSATTALSQFAGIFQSLDKVKAKYLGQALIDFMKHPVKVRNEIAEMSGEIRHLGETTDRDIRAVMKNFTTDESKIAQVQKFAFHGIALADAFVKVPTWLGAYRQALAEGRSKEAAILEADAAVRLTQGAGGAKDLSAIQRNNEFWKTMTMFYSYFNVLYNRMRDMGSQVQEIRDMPKFLSRALFSVMIPAVLGDLIVGRGPDDDEDEAAWIIRKMLLYPSMSIPIVRDIAASLESGYDYRFTPMSTAFEKIGKLAKATGKLAEGDMEWGDYGIKAVDTIGFACGVPGTTQITRSSKYLWRVYQGEENPDNIADLIYHASVGKKPEK